MSSGGPASPYRHSGAGSEALASLSGDSLPASALLPIALVVLVAFVDNFSQFPIIAPFARALGARGPLVGAVVAAYSVTNLLGNFLSGYLSDRLGRRRPLLLALVGIAGVMLLYVSARTAAQLLGVRAVHGLVAGILTPAVFALAGDRTPGRARGRAMGFLGIPIGLAAIAAPFASGLVKDRWGFDAVFSMVAVLALAAALLAWGTIRDVYRGGQGDPGTGAGYIQMVRRPVLAPAYLAILVLTFGLGGIVVELPLHAQALGYGGAQTGILFSAFSVTAVVAMAFGRISDRLGRLRPMLGGLGVIGPALFLIPYVQRFPALAALMGLFGLGFGLIYPAANALTVDGTLPEERGRGFALLYALFSVGVIAGSLVAGALSDVLRAADLSPLAVVGLVACGGFAVFAGRMRRASPAP